MRRALWAVPVLVFLATFGVFGVRHPGSVRAMLTNPDGVLMVGAAIGTGRASTYFASGGETPPTAASALDPEPAATSAACPICHGNMAPTPATAPVLRNCRLSIMVLLLVVNRASSRRPSGTAM